MTSNLNLRTDRRKTNFSKLYVENADLDKPVLKRIMNTNK